MEMVLCVLARQYEDIDAFVQRRRIRRKRLDQETKLDHMKSRIDNFFTDIKKEIKEEFGNDDDFVIASNVVNIKEDKDSTSMEQRIGSMKLELDELKVKKEKLSEVTLDEEPSLADNSTDMKDNGKESNSGDSDGKENEDLPNSPVQGKLVFESFTEVSKNVPGTFNECARCKILDSKLFVSIAIQTSDELALNEESGKEDKAVNTDNEEEMHKTDVGVNTENDIVKPDSVNNMIEIHPVMGAEKNDGKCSNSVLDDEGKNQLSTEDKEVGGSKVLTNETNEVPKKKNKNRSDSRKSEIDLDLVMKQTANQIENSDDESIKEDEALKDISFSDLPVIPADSDIPVEKTPQTESPKVHIEMKEDTQAKKDKDNLSNENVNKVIESEEPKPGSKEYSNTVKSDEQVERQSKQNDDILDDNNKCNTEGELVGTQSSDKSSSEQVTLSEAMDMLASPQTQLQNKDVDINLNSQQNKETDEDENRKEVDTDKVIIPEVKETISGDGDGQINASTEVDEKLSEASKESNVNLVTTVGHMKTPTKADRREDSTILRSQKMHRREMDLSSISSGLSNRSNERLDEFSEYEDKRSTGSEVLSGQNFGIDMRINKTDMNLTPPANAYLQMANNAKKSREAIIQSDPRQGIPNTSSGSRMMPSFEVNFTPNRQSHLTSTPMRRDNTYYQDDYGMYEPSVPSYSSQVQKLVRSDEFGIFGPSPQRVGMFQRTRHPPVQESSGEASSNKSHSGEEKDTTITKLMKRNIEVQQKNIEVMQSTQKLFKPMINPLKTLSNKFVEKAKKTLMPKKVSSTREPRGVKRNIENVIPESVDKSSEKMIKGSSEVAAKFTEGTQAPKMLESTGTEDCKPTASETKRVYDPNFGSALNSVLNTSVSNSGLSPVELDSDFENNILGETDNQAPSNLSDFDEQGLLDNPDDEHSHYSDGYSNDSTIEDDNLTYGMGGENEYGNSHIKDNSSDDYSDVEEPPKSKKRKHLTSPRSKSSRTKQYLDSIGPEGVKTNMPTGFMFNIDASNSAADNSSARMKGFAPTISPEAISQLTGHSSKSSKKSKSVQEEIEVDPRKIPDMEEADEGDTIDDTLELIPNGPRDVDYNMLYSGKYLIIIEHIYGYWYFS